MKLSLVGHILVLAVSLPVRGAWVEITLWRKPTAATISRSPCGERGLKCLLCLAGEVGKVALRAGSVG